MVFDLSLLHPLKIFEPFYSSLRSGKKPESVKADGGINTRSHWNDYIITLCRSNSRRICARLLLDMLVARPAEQPKRELI
jgi:hypothetical protein